MPKPRSKSAVRFVYKLLAVVAIGFGLSHLAWARQQQLKTSALNYLNQVLTAKTGYQVEIESVTMDWMGRSSIQSIRLYTPKALESGQREMVLKIKNLMVSYTWLDLFSKNPLRNIGVELEGVAAYYQAGQPVSLDKDKAGLWSWVHGLFMQGPNLWSVRIKDFSYYLDKDKPLVEKASFRVSKNVIEAEIPVRHFLWRNSDISTTLFFGGQYSLSPTFKSWTIQGDFKTEASVIDYKPTSHESWARISLGPDLLKIIDSDMLGGIHIRGYSALKKSGLMDFRVTARGYDISDIKRLPFGGKNLSVPSTLELDLHLFGSKKNPQIRGVAFFGASQGSEDSVKKLSLDVEGVYPTVNLSNSQILLEDGTIMRLANKTLEFKELFKSSTYASLIVDSPQQEVTLGKLFLQRSESRTGTEGVLVKQYIDDQTSVNLRQVDDKKAPVQIDENQKDASARNLGVGVEYLLGGKNAAEKNALKLEVKQNEEVIGVERKVKF